MLVRLFIRDRWREIWLRKRRGLWDYGGRDGREAATSPRTDPWSPQKLGEAGRTLSWRLRRELSPGTP